MQVEGSTQLGTKQYVSRCAAVTKAGHACRAATGEGREFCGFHDPLIAQRVREDASKAAAAARKPTPVHPDAPTEPAFLDLSTLAGVSAAFTAIARLVATGQIDTKTGNVLVMAASGASGALKAADDIADRAAKRMSGMSDADLDAAVREAVAEHLAGHDA